ncbi:hypothetical protein AKJ37_03710 [candidate division MSBL1 archaeon SCGC-AAA259I09]|uniref:glucose-1-phosphate thymidylyltransferase n=1 Tax=candidate division MSBL1 archaeon SCGC-AAA259I09 TaxID=1698267 RepID=A0A133USD0_9EURY|nr:hypothetical protein AKJ37_03710 [candidate division MSBL1 archaeon SCGC-AAA259I09]
MIERAVVLAAGKGTRLEPITHAVPKEVVRVGKKPTIEHVIRVLKHGGAEEILVIIGRKKQPIIDYLGSGDRFGLDIYYRVQEEPKGTAHAVSLAKGFIDKSEDFAIMYGDNYIYPYRAMEKIVKFHEKKDGNGTLVLHPVDDPRRFGVVKLEKEKIVGMIEKPSMEEAQPYKRDDHWLNIAGLMIVNSKIFKHVKEVETGRQGEKWLTDAVEKMRKEKNDLYGYVFEGKRFDIGTFDSLTEADRLAQEVEGSEGENSEE